MITTLSIDQLPTPILREVSSLEVGDFFVSGENEVLYRVVQYQYATRPNELFAERLADGRLFHLNVNKRCRRVLNLQLKLNEIER
jgi:hypothetical protein